MRTRFKTLTVGLVLVTAALAGCSSTTAGSSGAVQNAATASASAAASSAASTSPAPSPDPVTPTAAPTEASASPVASPTDLPSPSGSPDDPALLGASGPGSNNVCDAGLSYSCGDIGVSGVGTVFYASTTPFPCVANGVDMTSSCNYLEVAPNGWNGKMAPCKGGCAGSSDSTSDRGSDGPGTGRGYAYCTGSGNSRLIPNASGKIIGTGYPNTSAMLLTKWCKPRNAAEQVRRYTGGGMTDWSLPSQDELNALYYYTGRNAIGGFAADEYWSSSQLNKNVAWDQKFTDGSQAHVNKIETHGVRPVRAF